MSYENNEANTRKQIANFSIDEWIEFRERLDKISELNIVSERDIKILKEIIFNQKSTAELAYLGRTNPDYDWLTSNQNKPISTRRIQQILTKYFPEFHIHTTHKKQRKEQKLRNEQNIIRQTMITSESSCGKCGCKNNLQLHHIIPITLGGSNDDANLIILCNNCHQKITNRYLDWIRKNQDLYDKLVSDNTLQVS